MKKQEVNIYRCPCCAKPLKLEVFKGKNGKVTKGDFLSHDGIKFPIDNGIPDFTWPKKLNLIDKKNRITYDKLANEYDKYASLPFQTYYSNENEVYGKMISKLNLKPEHRVLEIGCGDGRGSEHIARKLNDKGKLYLQELSPAFLKKAVKRLKKYSLDIEYSIANGCYLSFPDNYFDAAYHFGGINTFSDVKRSLNELARVVKPGGRVVVGDESMAPWLRNIQFGKIMMNSNPLLKNEIPIADVPVNVCDVKIEWIMMGAFFVLEFAVGEGEPVANYHIDIPSERGGTHWTRFYGNLEGVTDEAKQLAIKAAKKSGKSRHKWVDEVIKRAAKRELGIK